MKDFVCKLIRPMNFLFPKSWIHKIFLWESKEWREGFADGYNCREWKEKKEKIPAKKG